MGGGLNLVFNVSYGINSPDIDWVGNAYDVNHYGDVYYGNYLGSSYGSPSTFGIIFCAYVVEASGDAEYNGYSELYNTYDSYGLFCSPGTVSTIHNWRVYPSGAFDYNGIFNSYGK